MENAHNTDIRDMLDMVARGLRSLQTDQGQKQSSSYEVRHFHKKLYLNPGLDDSMNLDSLYEVEDETQQSPTMDEVILAAKRDSLGHFVEALGIDANEELTKASEKGEVEKARLLIDVEGLDINKSTAEDGTTALWAASKSGNADIVELLLAHPEINCNVDCAWEGSTALHVAAHNGHVRVVELLLDQRGIDVNSVTSDCGRTALWTASSQGHVKVVRKLIGHPDIDVNLGTSGMRFSCVGTCVTT